MKTLEKIRNEIEKNQTEYRRVSSLNTGVIIGALDTSEITQQIENDIREYNSRSTRDHYVRGILEKK